MGEMATPTGPHLSLAAFARMPPPGSVLGRSALSTAEDDLVRKRRRLRGRRRHHRSEVEESANHLWSVLDTRLDPDVEILRRAWATVYAHGVSPDHQEADVSSE